MSEVIDPRWSEALALDRRRAPEFYAAGNEVPAASTHAEAIRFALDELGLSAVSCINGVPTIGFLRDTHVSVERIDELRSEERRVGKECVSTCRSRWSP